MNGILQFKTILNSCNMDKTVNERVKAVFEKSGERSIRSYALKKGIPPTTLNECIKGAEPRFSLLKAILDGEPSISAEWLIRGIGRMEITETIDAKKIEELNAEINMLKGENRVLREQVGLGERKGSRSAS